MKFILPGNFGGIEGNPEEILEFLGLMQMNDDLKKLKEKTADSHVLNLLIKRRRSDEGEWAILGIFDSGKKMSEAEEKYKKQNVWDEEDDYFTQLVITKNNLYDGEYDRYLYGYNGFNTCG